MAKAPKPRFVTLGKGSTVHVVHTETFDRKNSKCQTVRKFVVAGKVPSGSLSPEAASALDGCKFCHTVDVVALAIESSKTPDQKRQEAADRRDEVLARAKGGDYKAKKSKAKKAPKEKADKPAKAPRPTKSGPRSVATGAAGDAGKEKAELLIQFAKDHGWKPSLDKDGVSWKVTATRNTVGVMETIECYFTDGKYDPSRPASITAGSASAKLRGVHGVRNQMMVEETYKGRSKPRTKSKSAKAVEEDEAPVDESPEDAAKRVPFLLDDDDIVVIDAIAGKAIRWRNGTVNSVMEARVPSKSKRTGITTHPKTGRRILNFLEVVEAGKDGEVVGPERSIYLDKIIRVSE